MSKGPSRSSRKSRLASHDEVVKVSIKAAVAGCRSALSSGFEQQLALLGVFRDGRRLVINEVTDRWSAHRHRPGIDAALDRWEQQGYDASGSVDRFIREASYTWLNRLAALRALEVRGLTRPIVDLNEANRPALIASVGSVSSVLLQARETVEALLWESIFEEFAVRIGALFDPQDPHSFFPGSSAVLAALQALGKIDESTWREDDTLGWLYQFFSTKDERAKLRKKKGAAFTPDDLGAINQFFTPNWVVRFLVDNTLGTLWRRMRPQSKINELCTLMLPATDDDTRLPVKRVRDIKIIDPACGAMHFGVYAFDVLRRMYEEEGLEASREVPDLILSRNLAGIDIDRRAIQIAALNLYLKAALALRELGELEPRNLRMNLGCADAPPPSGEQQAKVRAAITDPALRQAVDVALSSLTYLHAVGSLLDVEADVRTALMRKTPALPPGHSPLPGLLAQLGVLEATEPSTLDAVVHNAREAAEGALRADDIAGALAAEDALLAAKVLQLVGDRYDVVLMNPPYGAFMPPLTKTYLHQRYPKSKSDIYGAFFELAFRLAEGGGAVGALTSKTFLYLDTFKHVRKLLLETGRLAALIDASTGVLFESTVPVGASVAWANPPSSDAESIVIRVVHSENPASEVKRVSRAIIDGARPVPASLYRTRLADLRKLPTKTIAYWAPPGLLAAYEKFPPLDPNCGQVRKGLGTGENERFLRFWWEVPAEDVGEGRRWAPFIMGGEYSPFYESALYVIDWRDDGSAVKASPAARPQNQAFYFRGGITAPKVADRFHARALAPGAIFSDATSGIFTNDPFPLLAYLNSRVAVALLMAQSTTRNFEVGQVGRLCVPVFGDALRKRLATIAERAVAAAMEYARGDELDRCFLQTWIESQATTSLAEAASRAARDRQTFLDTINMAQVEATELLNSEMGIAPTDWAQIERALGPELRVDENVKSVGSVKTKVDSLTTEAEQVSRYLASCCFEVCSSGRIMLLESVVAAVSDRVRTRFTEGDIDRALVTRIGADISKWCEDQFHNYHCTLYRGRPRIIRLSTRGGHVKALLDIVASTVDDLRKFQTDVLDVLENRVRSRLSAEPQQSRRLTLQGELEDCAEIREILDSAVNYWLHCDHDARARMRPLMPLTGYLQT